MKIKTMFLLAITFLPMIGNAQEIHRAYIQVMQSPSAERPCLFFKLQGVDQADSSYPGNPWFATLEGTHYYTEIAGMLTAAYHDKKRVVVATTGERIPQCGYHASVKYVQY